MDSKIIEKKENFVVPDDEFFFDIDPNLIKGGGEKDKILPITEEFNENEFDTELSKGPTDILDLTTNFKSESDLNKEKDARVFGKEIKPYNETKEEEEDSDNEDKLTEDELDFQQDEDDTISELEYDVTDPYKEEYEEKDEELDEEEEDEVIFDPEDNSDNDDNFINLINENKSIEFEIENDIEFNNNLNNIVVYEEDLIPEDKIIANDKQQSDDIFNELMKLVPENERSKKEIIKKNQNLLKNFIDLKEKNSLYDSNNNIIKPKIIDNNYNPIIEKLKNFDNTFLYKPIISEKKKIFQLDLENLSDLLEGFTDYDNSNSIFLEDNKNELKKYIDIKNKYKKGEYRLNYSFKNELNEIYELLDAYKSNKNNGYITNLKNDIEVYSDCINDECTGLLGNTLLLNKHILLGETTFLSDNIVVKGTNISNVGYLKYPNYTTFNSKLYENNSLNELTKLRWKNYENNFEESVIEKIDVSHNFKVNDKVNICDKYLENKEGTIVDITDENYIININLSNESLNIRKDDNNFIIVKLEDLKEKGNLCFKENSNSLTQYLYNNEDSLSKKNFEKSLQIMLPDLSTILDNIESKNKINNFDDINNILFKFNLNYDSLTYFHILPLYKNLFKNNSKKTNININYKYGENLNFISNRGNFSLINNYILDELEPYYGIYPLFNSKLDSDIQRLNWILSKKDSGVLYSKIITNNINVKINETKQSKLESLNRFIEKKEDELNKLKIKFKEVENNKKNLECKFRIVKIYTNIRDLMLDNNRKTKIDLDKLIESDKDEFVKEGHFCLYINDLLKMNELYKREYDTKSKQDIWKLQNKNILNSIIKSSEDLCEFQGLTIENIKISSFKSKNRCIYSDEHKKCVPFEYYKLFKNINNLNDIIKENKELYDELLDSDKKIKENNEVILKFQKQMELEVKKEERFNKLRNERYKNLLEKVDDKENEQFSELFYKIDKYLENISKLPNEEDYYLELDKLISKYGRKASELESDGENPKNIYCRLGSKKVMCCKHNELFIRYYKKQIVIDHLFDELIEDYGEEMDGVIWCNNCGKEILMSDYVSIEDFSSSGARIITHEVIEEENYESKQNNEMVEVLRKYLMDNNNKDITSNNSLNIVKIVSILTDMMGIKLLQDDELKIITSTELLIDSNIKSKSDWITNARKSKPKAKLTALENAYNSYKIRNIILFASANTFVYLQSGVPNYSITKTFTKCKPSLGGYPLEKTTKQDGIEYISCILSSLAQTGVDWSSLKKIKIKDYLVKIIDGIMKDDYIKYRFSKKRNYIKERDDDKEEFMKITSDLWNEFRPPLKSFNITIDNYDKLSISNIINEINKKPKNVKKISSLIEKFLENEYILSLKFIEEINNEINKNDLQNALFDPAPLDNFSCLQLIKSDFDYLQFFEQNKLPKLILSILFEYNLKKKKINEELNSKKIIVEPRLRKKLITFNKEIGIDTDSLSEEEIRNYFLIFIAKGEHKGKKHLFYKGLCELTGESENSIKKTIYSKQQLDELFNEINKTKLVTFNIETKKIIEDILSTLIENNLFLKSNDYINNFNTKLLSESSNINVLFKDIQEQIQIEIKLIVKKINSILKLKGKDFSELKNCFINLGDTTNLIDDNIKNTSLSDAELSHSILKIQLIKSYMTRYLKTILLKLNNNFIIDEEPLIPSAWGLDYETNELFKNLILSDKPFIDKYKSLFNNQKKTLLEMLNIVEVFTSNIELIIGQSHILDCNDNIVNVKKMTHKMLSSILKYIYLLLIDLLINLNNDYDEIENEYNFDVTELEQQELDISQSLNRNESSQIKLIYEIVLKIEKDRQYLDKHSSSYINKVIETKLESDKEANLRFIQDLDKETWTSLKNMISLGMDTWKNLSNKNKDLYIPPKEPVDDDQVMNTYDEQQDILDEQAQQDLGQNYSDIEYQQWLTDRQINDQENILAQQEELDIRNVVEDLDHDD